MQSEKFNELKGLFIATGNRVEQSKLALNRAGVNKLKSKLDQLGAEISLNTKE